MNESMKAIVVKPCPFCKELPRWHEGQRVTRGFSTGMWAWKPYVHCVKCNVGRAGESLDEVLVWWNGNESKVNPAAIGPPAIKALYEAAMAVDDAAIGAVFVNRDEGLAKFMQAHSKFVVPALKLATQRQPEVKREARFRIKVRRSQHVQ